MTFNKVMNMSQHFKLLPYPCQIAGLCCFIISFAALMTPVVTSPATNNSPDWLTKLIGIVFYLSLAAILFSREKKEDDTIRRIRNNTIVLCAILCLSVILLMSIIALFLSTDSYNAFKVWRQENLWNGKPVIQFAILYWLIFKIRVWTRKD